MTPATIISFRRKTVKYQDQEIPMDESNLNTTGKPHIVTVIGTTCFLVQWRFVTYANKEKPLSASAQLKKSNRTV